MSVLELAMQVSASKDLRTKIFTPDFLQSNHQLQLPAAVHFLYITGTCSMVEDQNY